MGIRLRGREYHYQIQVGGHKYTGPTGEEDRRRAEAIVSDIKTAIRRQLGPASIREMFQGMVAERIIEQLPYAKTTDALPLERAFEMWDQGDAAESTRRLYLSEWQNFVQFANTQGATTCTDVSTPLIQSWSTGIDGATATKRRKMAMVRSILSSVDPARARDVFAGIRRPRHKSVYTREILTEDQIHALRNGLEGEDLIMFLLGLEVGLRLGDACGLRWDDVDLDNRIIRVVTEKRKKAVSVPISQNLFDALRDREHSSEYVCPAYNESYKSCSKQASKKYAKAISKLGINTQIEKDGKKYSVLGFHSLRHCYAYYALLSGVPAQFVVEMIGHSVFNQTLKYAGHGTMDHKAQALKSMWDRF